MTWPSQICDGRLAVTDCWSSSPWRKDLAANLQQGQLQQNQELAELRPLGGASLRLWHIFAGARAFEGGLGHGIGCQGGLAARDQADAAEHGRDEILNQ